MATSDVLQFHYCIENEDVRNATKNFAGILGDAFEQYKKLWIEYIKLQKYCENAGVKIPFQVFESKSDNSNIALLKTAESCIDLCSKQTNETSSKNSATYNLDNALGLNETILADDKFGQKQIVNDKLLYSPILIKRHKPKRNSITPGRSILDDTNEIDMSIPLRENITILANSSDEDLSIYVETKENQCLNILDNKDEIECTPVSRLPKKMKLSKLYNIETTLLKSGKKLKQSRLAFVPSEESKMPMDEKKHKKLTKLLQPEFLTSTKNLQKNIKVSGSNEVVDEEIIEDSPTKRNKSKLKIRSLKLKKSCPAILRDDISRQINLVSDTKIGSISQCSTIHTCTQNELYSVETLKSFNTSENKSVRNNYEILPSLSLVDTERMANNVLKEEAERIYTERIVNIPEEETEKMNTKPIVNNIPKEKTEKIYASNESQTQKRKLSKLIEGTCNSNLSCDDETFCLLGERLKEKTEKIDTKPMNNNRPKEEIEKIDISIENQAQKRKLSQLVEETCNPNLSCDDETFCLLGERLQEKSTSKVPNTKISNNNISENVSHNSSDVAPKKEDIVIGKTRNKAERAKMAGTACWECVKR